MNQKTSTVDIETGDRVFTARRRALRTLTAGLTSVSMWAAHDSVQSSAPAEKKKTLRPECVAFDVVETLFPLEPLRDRLKRAGLPGEALELWFSRLIRDAFALDASGVFKPFSEVARATLEALFDSYGKPYQREGIDRILAGFGELDAHPDAIPALRRLRDAGVRAWALTNGSAELTRKLLKRNGLDGLMEDVVSIEEIRRWKPHRDVYLHAVKRAKVSADRLALVAAHSWDIHGASQAGLTTGWVSRLEKQYHRLMHPPDVNGGTLDEVVRKLLALPQT